MSGPKSGIAGWPEHDRPRERMFDKGPAALSDAELVALLVRTGALGRSAVDVSRQLLRDAGTLKALADRPPAELRRKGLGPAKAAAIAAAFELGRRAASQPDTVRPTFTSSADIFRFFAPSRTGRSREVFEIAILDTKHRLIRRKIITVGTLNLALVHPRDVFRPALAEGAAGIVLVHNHPSGDPTPSEEDIRLTRQLGQAGDAVGIRVLDHVILGKDRWFSFADTKRLER